MGTKLAPLFANLFMDDLEEKFVYTYQVQPFIWKRFIDDIFIIWTHGETKRNKFVTYLNTCHDTIKFTAEISNTSIDFLDITVKNRNNGVLATTLFCKPTDSHNYLLYSSEHPRHILTGIPYSQFLRIRRICSDITDFKTNAFMLSTHFIRRGYPKHLIIQAIDKCLRLNREDLLIQDLLKQLKKTTDSHTRGENKGDTFYCSTTHNPQNPNLKSIIQNNSELLQKTKTTRHLENAWLIFGLRRNKLKTYLTN